VAQSLFGIVFTLDACIQMLPANAGGTRQDLIDLRDLASDVRQQVRRSIYDLWPSEMTLERFESELTQHASQSASDRPLQVEFSTQGDFNQLPAAIRRVLFQVAQEALTNVAHHSGCDCASLQLEIMPGQVYLQVSDAGAGFDPVAVLNESAESGLGLRGIRERVQALGGDLQIDSRPGGGTRLAVLPANGVNRRG
jgi:two-component system NarL family sensor kinase